MCDLCYLCLFTYGGVQHILCCGFVLFVFTLCLVLSSPCVLLPPVVCRRNHVLFTFGSSSPPVVCSYLCLFEYSGVQHILCCFCFVFVFPRFVHPILSVSLDCPCLIAP